MIFEKKNKARSKNIWLVVEPNPFEKYACQIGSFPQVGMKMKNI